MLATFISFSFSVFIQLWGRKQNKHFLHCEKF